MGDDLTPLPYEQVRKVQEALTTAVGTGGLGSYYESEVTWWRLRVGDILTINVDDVVYEAVVVDEHEQLDDFSYWSQPIYYVIKTMGRYFRVTGRNVSHEGNNWDWIGFEEVVPKIETRKAWTGADR